MLRRKTRDLVKSRWSQMISTVANKPCGNRNAVEELGDVPLFVENRSAGVLSS